MKNHTTKDHHGKKHNASACANPLNAVITKCIRRQLVLTCPTWVKNDTCTTLMTFAKNCPAYPFGECGGKHGKDGHDKGSHWVEKVPGCEKAASVKDIKANDCCPALSNIIPKGAWKNCSASCEKSDNEWCCKTGCMLANLKVADSAGKLDEAKAKAVLKAGANNAAWVRLGIFLLFA